MRRSEQFTLEHGVALSTVRFARPFGSRPRARAAVLGAVAVVIAGVGGGIATAEPTAKTASSQAGWDALAPSLGVVQQGTQDMFERNILPSLSIATRLSDVTSGQPMTVDLAIAHPHQAAENALAAAMVDKSSPSYHRYVTPQQYDATYGIPAETVSAAKTWASDAGLAIESVSGAGDIVQLRGPATTVAKAFGVTLGNYTSQGKTFIANSTVPSLPAALHVQTVVGLNTIQAAVPDKADFTASAKQSGSFTSRVATGTTAKAATSGPKPAVLGLTPNGPFTAQDMWSLYDLPDTNKGSGASAGIFIEGAMAPLISDLRLFEERSNLPKVPVRIVTEGAAGAQTDNLGADEWDLDTDAITGMAPDISSLSYYDAASFADADLLPDFAKWRDDPDGPVQMNASFGECEEVPAASPALAQLPTNNLPFGVGLGDTTEPVFESVLQTTAAMEGRTLFASAGDTAASCPAVILPGVGALNGLNDEAVPVGNYPASSKWAVSVGGTDIESDGGTPPKRVLEYGEPTAGGGSSLAIDQQPWMKPVTAMVQPCAVDETGAPYPAGTICRGMPDVSALYGGQVAAGYDTVTNHQVGSGGGTSLSSPLTVGMWTRIQAAAPKAAGLGFAQQVIYDQGNKAATTGRDFYDVIVGDNNNPATPGWDHDTGWGVIDDANFMMDTTGRLTPARPAAQAAVADPTTNACNPLFTTFAGNANDALDLTTTQDPSLDITGGDIRDSADGKSLVVSLSGPTYSPTLDSNLVPFGADSNLIWEVGSTLYYARASVAAASGTVSYEAGTVTGNLGGFAAFTPAAGAVTGTFATGKLTMTVPLSDVGNPAKGTRLKYPLALVESQELGPVFGAIGIDAGTDQDYVTGSLCAAAAGTPAVVAATTTKKVTKKAAKKAVKKKAAVKAKKVVVQPSRTLAFTGAPAGLSLLALLIVGSAMLTGRLKRARR